LIDVPKLLVFVGFIDIYKWLIKPYDKEKLKMKKHTFLAVLIALVLALGCASAAHAEIIPPHGEGQIGRQAVVLCDSLTVRQAPDVSSRTVETLKYKDLPIVVKESNGWAYVVLGDSEDSASGWVNADYIAIDPSWYRTEQKTPVYAWDNTLSPKVALLSANTTLPILADQGDWLIVSLRGATGWIHIGNRY